jgi:hypothetical protein
VLLCVGCRDAFIYGDLCRELAGAATDCGNIRRVAPGAIARHGRNDDGFRPLAARAVATEQLNRIALHKRWREAVLERAEALGGSSATATTTSAAKRAGCIVRAERDNAASTPWIHTRADRTGRTRREPRRGRSALTALAGSLRDLRQAERGSGSSRARTRRRGAGLRLDRTLGREHSKEPRLDAFACLPGAVRSSHWSRLHRKDRAGPYEAASYASFTGIARPTRTPERTQSAESIKSLCRGRSPNSSAARRGNPRTADHTGRQLVRWRSRRRHGAPTTPTPTDGRHRRPLA